MRVTTLTKTYGRTVNIGNYNSIRFENTAEAVVEPGEDITRVDEALYELVKNATEADIVDKLNAIQAEQDEIFSHAIAQHGHQRRG